MRGSLLLAVLFAIALPLAGCLGGTETPTDEPADPNQVLQFDFVNATWPDGHTARDLIESYVMTHPFRLNSPATADFMATARDGLEGILTSYNLTVQRHEYETGVNILGIKNGTTEPHRWVVLSAHYDTTESTIYGAWDDGAGVAALLAIGAAITSWDLPYTVVLAFFDEEEQGLVGSGAFVQEFGADPTLDLVANINMDPPGLNWPCGDALGPFPVKIIHNQAKVDENKTTRYPWLHAALEHGLNATGVPMEVRDYSPGIPIATAAGTGLSGTSDHANFDAADIANVFLGGVPATRVVPDDQGGGLVAAMTYGLHTPLDTLQQMELRCTGGDGTLADGLHTIVTTTAHTLQFMAETGIPAL